jgi:hypothetical protein
VNSSGAGQLPGIQANKRSGKISASSHIGNFQQADPIVKCIMPASAIPQIASLVAQKNLVTVAWRS